MNLLISLFKVQKLLRRHVTLFCQHFKSSNENNSEKHPLTYDVDNNTYHLE